jgi:GNAT superfamily N-acetyltransferase
MRRASHWFPVTVPDGRSAGVRDARPSDAKAALAGVARIVQERPRTLLVSEGELWTTRQWRERRQAWTPEGAWLVAELDGQFVGMYAVQRGARKAERHVAEFGIWVLPEGRGLGLGAALIAAGEKWAEEQRSGCTRSAVTKQKAGNDAPTSCRKAKQLTP